MKMISKLSKPKNKMFAQLKKWKDLRHGLLFTLSFFLITNGGQASAACVGWLCGPKQTLTTAFPTGSAVINTGFALMQGVIIAILVGMGAKYRHAGFSIDGKFCIELIFLPIISYANME